MEAIFAEEAVEAAVEGVVEGGGMIAETAAATVSPTIVTPGLIFAMSGVVSARETGATGTETAATIFEDGGHPRRAGAALL